MTIEELTSRMQRMKLMFDQASVAVGGNTPHHSKGGEGGKGGTLTSCLSHMEQLGKIQKGGGKKKNVRTARKVASRRQWNRRTRSRH